MTTPEDTCAEPHKSTICAQEHILLRCVGYPVGWIGVILMWAGYPFIVASTWLLERSR